MKPVYLNADAEFVNAEDPVTVEGIVGVLMDRDAAGYNLADDSLVTSPYNAKGQYYNIFNHVRIQLQNDLTEKAVVFCIGEGGGGGTGLKFVVPEQTITIDENGTDIEVDADLVSEESTYVFKMVTGDDTYYSDMIYVTSEEPHLLYPTQTIGEAEAVPTIELQPDNSWLFFGGSFEGSVTVSVIVSY